MNLTFKQFLAENIERTGDGSTAVIGWGRGMGHKGHMMLASSVITHANELGADPYFIVSRTVGKNDPLHPEEKIEIYQKVFPGQAKIFQPATDEMGDLVKVLSRLNKVNGYDNAVVVVGSDQVKAFQFLQRYNGSPDKQGNVAYEFDDLQVISRQETNDPSRTEDGPRATPMRKALNDPDMSDEDKFNVWRDSISPEIDDDSVRELMKKAKTRMDSYK